MLSDIEFVAEFHVDLLDDYRVAKSYVRDVPTQALLHIRSLTHKLTRVLGAVNPALKFTSPNLYDRIEQLNRGRLIDVRTTRALHRLRSDGNRGAHPEKYHLTETQLITLAEKALRDVLSLLAHLYVKYKGVVTPEFQFIAFDSQSGRDLCFRAVMENDPLSQYLVGMSLKAKALMLQDQDIDAAVQHDQHMTANHAFARAAYWFALASPHHHEALYEHGVALLHGYDGDKQVERGEKLIVEAAQQGVANAMALVGYFYLVGSHTIQVDLSLAEKYLRAAADAEQAEAMANLGVLYYQKKDLQQAFAFISKAAQAGFPHAQYHLALMFASGEGCAVDLLASEQWMAEAAEQGQLDAMLARAQHMLNDEHAFGSDLSQAEHYLREVIKYGKSVPAMIELSMALADGLLGRIDVVGSAALLKLAREHATADQEAVIAPLWQSLALQINNVLNVTENAAEKQALQKAQQLLTR